MHRHCEKPAEPSKQVQMFDELQKREERTGRCIVGGESTVAPANRELPIICVRCGNQVAAGEATIHFERCMQADAAEAHEHSGVTPLHAAIDAATDSPAPEIDPPGPTGDYDKFYEMYPFAQDVPALRRALCKVLTPEQGLALQAQPLPPPDTAAFQYMAAWVRHEQAHLDSEERGLAGAIPGLTIPARLPMPKELKALLEPPKPKRGARPLANPKKRRSGSTANSD